MIYSYLNQGSGIGNQLHRYIATRIKAMELGTDWRMIYNTDGSGKPEYFKANNFIDFDMDKVLYEPPSFTKVWNEKKIVENGVDIRSYDPEFNFIEDNTIIEGEFQDERYWEKYEKEVDEWLKVEPLDIRGNICVIGFRGGEFAAFPDLFLAQDYWKKAIEIMNKVTPVGMEFEVHTDDEILAKQFFPNLKIVSNPEINWRSMRYATYAIIANSSFYVLPRWLNGGITIAPHYWARRNKKTWALPQNFYKRFLYI